MPEWLSTSLSTNTPIPTGLIACRIVLALILGAAVAGLYKWARRGESTPATFTTTLVLLAALIAMATQVIGDNVARAFSLVGALSVVRFRTVVKDTQDTAFVIFAVVVGMAAGTNNIGVALVGLAIVAVASLALWPHRRGDNRQTDCTLSLRVSIEQAARTEVDRVLALTTRRFSLISAETTRQGLFVDLVYRLRLKPECSAIEMVTEMNMLEFVKKVTLSRRD